MAKRKDGTRYLTKARGGVRDTKINVGIRQHAERIGQDGPKRGVVTACVTMAGKGRRAYNTVVCERGTNPRKALSKALHRFATNIGQRKGALAGLK